MRFYLTNPNAKELDTSKIAHQLYGLGYHPLEYRRWYMRLPVVRMMYGLAKLRFPEMENEHTIDWLLVLCVVFTFVRQWVCGLLVGVLRFKR